MSAEITHVVDDDGHYRQVVPARRLTEILQRDGESSSPPGGFGPLDEWFVCDGHEKDEA